MSVRGDVRRGKCPFPGVGRAGVQRRSSDESLICSPHVLRICLPITSNHIAVTIIYIHSFHELFGTGIRTLPQEVVQLGTVEAFRRALLTV